MPNNLEQWEQPYRILRRTADAAIHHNTETARMYCARAGLWTDYLGIHPHNAMVAYEQGRPWPEVDYRYVRLCLHAMRHTFDPSRVVEAWNRRNFDRLCGEAQS